MALLTHSFSSISQEMNDWNVSGITDFSELFYDKFKFNEDIFNWDVSSGENFASMFRDATSFNQDLSSWNVSSGTSFVSAVLTWAGCALCTVHWPLHCLAGVHMIWT